MAEEIGFRLGVDPGNSVQTVGNFKKELRDAKREAVEAARSFGEFSPQAIAAAKKFAELNDTLKDTNELAGVLAGPDKFKAFANLAGGLAGGFAAVQGAIGLVGEQSKDLEKALLKVNSAIALSNGLTQVADLGKFFNQAKAAVLSFEVVQKINNATTKAAAATQKLFTGAVAETSVGFKVLRGAIAATGIGLLVVAVGAIVENFDKLKKAVLNLIPGLAKVGEFFEKITNAVTDFIGITSEATRSEDALRLKIASTNEETDRAIQLAEAQGRSSKEVRKLKNQQYDDEIAKLREIQALTGGSDEDKKRLKELEFQKQLLAAQQDKEDRDAAEAKRKKEEEEGKRAAEKRKQEAEKKRQEAIENAELEVRAKYQRELEVEQELKEKKAKEDVQVRGKGTEGATLESFRQNAEALRERGRLQAEALEEIAINSEERELELLQRKYDRLRAVAQGNEALITAITESEAQARAEVSKKWDDIQFQQKQEQQQKIGSLLNQASNVFGRTTSAGKAIAVAGATIDTYRGATAALRASAGAGPFGAALAIAQAAIIVASGIKSVREILKTQVPGGGGSSPSVTSAATASSAPAVSTAPTMQGVQSTLLDATRSLATQQQDRKAYVVESEVTEKQERVRAIQQSASF